MSNDRYRFKLGDFECLAILDMAAYTFGNADFLFPNVPHNLLREENINPASTPFPGICLAVHTGTDWVLLDAGIGFANKDSKLAQILEEENIQPRHIILTHLDLDHYAGLINSDHTPAFPNAYVHICRDAWSLFTSAVFYEDNDTYDRREHLPLIEDQVNLVECVGEVLPGFSMIPLPGHREHHLGIMVESNGKELFFVADVVCHPLHIEHLDWHCGADAFHELARETRMEFAQMAVERGCLVQVYHFDFPGLGHVLQDGDGWKWQPLAL